MMADMKHGNHYERSSNQAKNLLYLSTDTAYAAAVSKASGYTVSILDLLLRPASAFVNVNKGGCKGRLHSGTYLNGLGLGPETPDSSEATNRAIFCGNKKIGVGVEMANSQPEGR